jgi:hypothetical protein
VPESPELRRRPAAVVADPDDLLVGWDGERDPGAVDVVSPEQVVGDDPASRVNDGDDPLQWEPLVRLEVQ